MVWKGKERLPKEPPPPPPNPAAGVGVDAASGAPEWLEERLLHEPPLLLLLPPDVGAGAAPCDGVNGPLPVAGVAPAVAGVAPAVAVVADGRAA